MDGLEVDVYDIRHGETTAVGDVAPVAADGRAFQAGAVLGLASHGALADAGVLSALVGARPHRDLEAVFDGLADLVEEHLDVGDLARLAGVA